jgi:16S rRNA processing protein RimM
VPEQQKTEWATIGQVVALFGVRGELKVRLLTDIPDRFTQLSAIFVGPEHRKVTIERSRPYKGEMIILKLGGFDDANAAELLLRQEIVIPVSQLAELPADSYYQHDILDLMVETLEHRELGRIVDILQTGSNDVYIVKDDGREILLPAIKDVVQDIDLSAGVMTVHLLEGLL